VAASGLAAGRKDAAMTEPRTAPEPEGIECPMCGGVGRIFNITEALSSVIASGAAMVVPLKAETENRDDD
jgi:hypothetical protein